MENQNILSYKLKEGICSRQSPLLAVNNPIHYHDGHYELEIVESGSGEMLFNDKMFTLTRGDIYLMRPSDRHGHTSNGLVFRQIETKDELLPKWVIKKAFALNNPVVAHADEEETTAIIFMMTLLEKELTSEKQYFESNSISLVEIIYTYFFRLVYKDNIDTNKVISKIMYFLQYNNRFLRKVTLKEIAEQVNYSEYYVSSLFHKNFGKTLQEYIVSLRLEYARKLLLQTNMSITDIIYESGFSTSSNFYTQFKKVYKLSPVDFKKKNKKFMK